MISCSIKVSTDTRTIKPGEYFVPIKGPNYDGSLFVQEALNKGALGIISEQELYDMAFKKLRDLKPRVIGIAGSIGKTTFRSYLTQILSYKYKVLEGTQNTKLGLALKIINELDNYEIFVAEMGIDHVGEMQEITDFFKPEFSVITKLGKEHIEFIGSFDNVIKENLISVSNSFKKTGYLNYEDEASYINKLHSDLAIIWFPIKTVSNSIKIAIDTLEIPQHDKNYLIGIYQLISGNFTFGENDFINSLTRLSKPKGRLNVLKGVNGCTVIDDTYNAVCDQTIIEGLKFVKDLATKQGKKLHIVLSNMRENGITAEEQHKNVAEFLNTIDFDSLYLVGDSIDLYKAFLKKNYTEVIKATDININPTEKDLFYIKATGYYKGADLVVQLTLSKISN